MWPLAGGTLRYMDLQFFVIGVFGRLNFVHVLGHDVHDRTKL